MATSTNQVPEKVDDAFGQQSGQSAAAVSAQFQFDPERNISRCKICNRDLKGRLVGNLRKHLSIHDKSWSTTPRKPKSKSTSSPTSSNSSSRKEPAKMVSTENRIEDGGSRPQPRFLVTCTPSPSVNPIKIKAIINSPTPTSSTATSRKEPEKMVSTENRIENGGSRPQPRFLVTSTPSVNPIKIKAIINSPTPTSSTATSRKEPEKMVSTENRIEVGGTRPQPQFLITSTPSVNPIKIKAIINTSAPTATSSSSTATSRKEPEKMVSTENRAEVVGWKPQILITCTPCTPSVNSTKTDKANINNGNKEGMPKIPVTTMAAKSKSTSSPTPSPSTSKSGKAPAGKVSTENRIAVPEVEGRKPKPSRFFITCTPCTPTTPSANSNKANINTDNSGLSDYHGDSMDQPNQYGDTFDGYGDYWNPNHYQQSEVGQNEDLMDDEEGMPSIPVTTVMSEGEDEDEGRAELYDDSQDDEKSGYEIRKDQEEANNITLRQLQRELAFKRNKFQEMSSDIAFLKHKFAQQDMFNKRMEKWMTVTGGLQAGMRKSKLSNGGKVSGKGTAGTSYLCQAQMSGHITGGRDGDGQEIMPTTYQQQQQHQKCTNCGGKDFTVLEGKPFCNGCCCFFKHHG